MQTGIDLYIWASTFALVLTSVFCAVVRWFHTCRPYGKYSHYFYPSRKSVTILYLLPLLEIPYLIHPDSLDAWILVRCLTVLYAPAFASITLRSFFFGNLNQWFKKMFWIVLLPGLMMLYLFFHSLDGGNYLGEYDSILMISTLIYSAFISVSLLIVFTMMMKRIRAASKQEYSSEEDFPARFGLGTAILSILMWALAVAVFLVGNQLITAIFNNLMSIVGFVLLIVILHPHRIKCSLIEKEMIRIIEEKSSDKISDFDDAEEESKPEIPAGLKKDIEERIRKVVIDGKLFLDPKFSKTQLVSLVGTNRTYLTEVLRDSYGSFYSFINKIRIEYAAEYSKEHPTATNSEIASESGFGSVRTYTRVRNLYYSGEL